MVEKSTFSRLNFVRILIVLAIAFGYASTMPIGPEAKEYLTLFGYEPSWLGIQVLFFFSGFLALHSLQRRKSMFDYLRSKVLRNAPLLFAFTLAAILIIFPLFGVKSGDAGQDIKVLGQYFIQTVSCINPGHPLPGLLDEAKYACLIQGAIWTFRWGAIAHIAAAIGWRLGLFSKKRLIALYAIAATLSYIAVVSYAVHTGSQENFDTALIGLRLAYPFAVGMAVYAYRNKLPEATLLKSIVLIGLGGFAAMNWFFMPWSPLIEISLTGFWIYGAYLLAFSTTPKLHWTENWPHLALGLYLANWPAAQILLMLNPDFTPLGLMSLSIPFAICLAVLAYAAVHGPATNLLNKKLGRKITV